MVTDPALLIWIFSAEYPIEVKDNFPPLGTVIVKFPDASVVVVVVVPSRFTLAPTTGSPVDLFFYNTCSGNVLANGLVDEKCAE